jgi:hypothetical protein
MYVVACTLENSTMAYRLHGIDITTGSEPLGPGVLITGSYGGYTFDAPYQGRRRWQSGGKGWLHLLRQISRRDQWICLGGC